MRHNKKINHLGRKSAHRNAMLSNMCTSLLLSPNKRIFTTVAKAKALRKVVEPIITKSKEDTTQSRRLVFQELDRTVPKYLAEDSRPSGRLYTYHQDR